MLRYCMQSVCVCVGLNPICQQWCGGVVGFLLQRGRRLAGTSEIDHIWQRISCLHVVNMLVVFLYEYLSPIIRQYTIGSGASR